MSGKRKKTKKSGDKKDKKSDFYKRKKVTNIDNINANKILVSTEELYGSCKMFIWILYWIQW